MRQILTSIFLVLCFFAGWCVCSACAQTQPVKRAATLGGIFDLTSDVGRLWGTAEKNAFLLAIRDFGAVHPDFKVESMIEDSAYSNPSSVSAFHKLTSVHRIKYIVGPTWEMFVAIMPLCEREKIVCLSPSNNSREFDNSQIHYSFTAYFREEGYSTVLAQEINRRGPKETAVFGAISPYHDPQVDNLLSRLVTKPKIVERVLSSNQDFRSLIAKVPDSTEALALFLLNDGQLYSFLKQWAALKRIRPPIFTDDSPIYDARLPKIREFGLEIFYSTQYFPPEIAAAWEQKYRAAYGVAPEAPSSSVSYDETMLLLNCIYRDPETSAVSVCLSGVSKYKGLSGLISFDGKHSAQSREFEVKRLE